MMRVLGALLLASTALVPATTSAAGASAAPVHTLTVTGTGVALYPAFDSVVERYGVTTTGSSAGTVTVTAATSDPAGTVLVDGRPVAGGSATVSGLTGGDEIPVVFEDAGGRSVHALVYLPARFPRLTTVIDGPGVTEGDVLVTLNKYDGSGAPTFEAALDRNGVPSHVAAFASDEAAGDLKPAGFSGHYTVLRSPTPTPGRTGGQLVELDEQFREVRRLETVGLVDTDTHDSLLRADGSRILTAYEPDPVTGLQDAVIQEVDPDGEVVYTWDSAEHMAPATETMRDDHPDYAHLNSVEMMSDGDLLASFRHLSSVYKIAWSDHDGYERGDIVWKLGGRDSDFSFPNDPFGSGPCAQHTATELPGGNIMVFDNGSTAFAGQPSYCVDPEDPVGPGVGRPQTRVTEYALDTQAGTATIAWNFQRPGWWALFAGSARRLAGGNTMIGWAAERRALATEVDPEGAPVWELKNDDGYMTYRAVKAVVPDAVDPTVELTGPADGATYDAGATVAPEFRCRDRGGSSLQACAGPERLDTTTVGEHTWTVTATDGAGNTTTAERRYTVLPPAAYRPDVMVKSPGASWIGNNVYGGYRKQRIRQSLPKAGAVRIAVVRVQNEANRAERLNIEGTAGGTRFRVRYFTGGADVTRRAVAGTLWTPVLEPGRYLSLTVVVTRLGGARPGDGRTLKVLATSAHAATRRDAVATVVRATR